MNVVMAGARSTAALIAAVVLLPGLAGGTAGALPASAAAAGPPGADRWQDAPQITELPFSAAYDFAGADDDGPPIIQQCPLDRAQAATVWWRFTPDTSGDLVAGLLPDHQVGLAEVTAEGLTAVHPVRYPVDDANCNQPGRLPVLAGHTYYVGVAEAYPTLGDLDYPFGSSGTVQLQEIVPGRVSAFDVAAQDASVTVSWQPPPDAGNAGITGYAIEVTGPTGTPGRVVEVGAQARTAQVTGLTNGTTYQVGIAARRGDVVGTGRSATVLVAPQLTAPGDVTAVADRVARTITLTWSPASGRVTGYRVTRRAAGGGAKAVDLPAAARSWTSPALAPWRATTFDLQALTDGGVGPAVSITRTLTLAQPSVPGGVLAVDGRDAIRVTWQAPTYPGDGPVTGYRVRRYDAAGALVATTQVDAAERTLAVGGTPLGVAFTFDVAAVNAHGIGDPSPRSRPAARVLPPAVSVAAVRAAEDAANPGLAQLEWDAVSGTSSRPVTGYRVRYVDPATGLRRETDVDVPRLALRAEPWTSLQVSVAARNAAGIGRWVASAVTVVGTRPSAPRNVALAVAGDGRLRASWEAPEHVGAGPIRGWRVQAYLAGQVPGSTAPHAWVELDDVAARTAALTGLAPGTAYVVVVRAIGPGGVGSPSSPSSPVRAARPPGPPVVTRVVAGPGSVTLGWQAPRANGYSPVTGYVVTLQRLTDDGSVAETLPPTRTGASPRTATVAGVAPGRYAATVSAVNAAGEGTPSARSAVVTVAAP